MGRHDVYLVQAETQPEVEQHVEGGTGEGDPQETAATPASQTSEEEQKDDGFDDVLYG